MKSDIVGVNQHNIENGELKTNAGGGGGELGHISSAAGMNFSGEYFICVTGTRLSHRADPLTAPTCKDKRRKKKKGRVKILLAAQENLQLPSAWLFLTFLTMRGRGGGVGGGGGRLSTFHRKDEKSYTSFINQPRGKKSSKRNGWNGDLNKSGFGFWPEINEFTNPPV